MKIDTTRFGSQEIDPETILTFPHGMPGFEHCHRFQLFHEDHERPVVYHLQSLDDPDISLSVVDPAQLGLSYEISLSDTEIQDLEFIAEDPVVVLLILSTVENSDSRSQSATGGRITPHVTSPLLINLRTRQGLQKRITGLEYSIHLRVPESN